MKFIWIFMQLVTANAFAGKIIRSGLLFFMLLLFGEILISCQTEGQSPIDAKSPIKAETGNLKWHDKSFSVFHGIPARVAFAVQADKAGEKTAKELLARSEETYAEINRIFNSFDKTSEVGRLNANPTADPIPISEEMSKAVKMALDISTASDGAFDLTVWPLKTLWSAAPRKGAIPSAEEIDKALEAVGSDKLIFSESEGLLTKKTQGLSLDFGGIIKGYVVDQLHLLFTEAGVGHALIQCGGEIRVWGLNSDGHRWRIGIQHPLQKGAIRGSISGLNEFAISTSGNYRQPIKIGESSYYHIFDPRNGQPVSTDILGVTVMISIREFPNARADAWATALAVLGWEKGLKLSKKHGFDVLYFVKSKEGGEGIDSVMSEGMRRFFTPPD